MARAVLQIPMDKSLRDEATSAAFELGFSSLQESVRVFLQSLANRAMSITFEPTVKLSDKNDRRYAKMLANVKSGKVKTKTFTDTNKLMDYLNS